MCSGRGGGRAGWRSGWRALLALVALAAFAPAPAAAQQDEMDASRRRLEEIRQERERLRQQREALVGQVHDVEDELQNIERQKESTSRIVNEIERQIGTLESQLDRSTAELVLAQDNLGERRAVLERRLVDIYKRGNLYTFQVLLSAESFGDLLSRYKYLYLTSRQDRDLVTDVEALRNRVVANRNDILRVRNELDRSRKEREAELQRFGDLAQERARSLQGLRRTAEQTDRRLRDLARDEARLNDVLAALERRRKEELAAGPRRGGTVPKATISTSDLGRLDWPVDGKLVYRFGRDTLPSGGVIRWNGVGIAAPLGTGVKAVEAGTVRLVGPFGTYGLTVLLEHGNGFYSIYSHLQNPGVKQGDAVVKGQVIAQVGGEQSDYGPHLHFEIRGENQVALDPAQWLRRR
ncbi:MAG: peptidoglycan DD-metalloendopeptidase family protein [Gemmatimonadales bacterium]|nr:peptidoglycan DD-metalloendopeptidase family protein [Gemmatimonadales bacterium]